MRWRPTGRRWCSPWSRSVMAVIFSTRFGDDPNLVPSPLLGQPAPTLALPLARWLGNLRLCRRSRARWCGQLLRLLVHPLSRRAGGPHCRCRRVARQGVTVVEIVYQDTADNALAFLNETGVSDRRDLSGRPGRSGGHCLRRLRHPRDLLRRPLTASWWARRSGPPMPSSSGPPSTRSWPANAPGRQVLGETFDGPTSR